jgi:hypothetical protein
MIAFPTLFPHSKYEWNHYYAQHFHGFGFVFQLRLYIPKLKVKCLHLERTKMNDQEFLLIQCILMYM